MKTVLTSAFILTFCMLNCISANAQYTIDSKKGYTPQIGIMVDMLEDLKGRVSRQVRDLNEEETDFLLDEKANRIGAMILHLAATEAYYQVFTFERRNFNQEEAEKWTLALGLGDLARQELVGKPIQYYLDIWDEVRQETLSQLKTKNDKWLAAKAKGGRMNNHWAWFHVMEHQANHMGQLQLILNRME